jgi:hypothetical protein
MAKRLDVRWPKNPSQCADFEQLTEPILKALRFAYQLERKNKNMRIPWTGLDTGPDCAATCLAPEEALSKDALAWALDEHGREALEVIMQVALQLGIEQGRRLALNKMKERLCLPLVYMDSLRGYFEDLKTRCGYEEAADGGDA